MGQALFWLEAAVASVLFVALGVAVQARVRSRLWRGFLGSWWWIVAITPWLAVVGSLGLLYRPYMFAGAFGPFMLAAVMWGVFLVAAKLVGHWGRANLPSVDGTGSPAWRSPRWRWGYIITTSLSTLLLMGWFIRLWTYGDLWFMVLFVGWLVCVVASPVVRARGRAIPSVAGGGVAPPVPAWRSLSWRLGYIASATLGALLLVWWFVRLVVDFDRVLMNSLVLFVAPLLGGVGLVVAAVAIRDRERTRLSPPVVETLPAWRASRWGVERLALVWAGAVLLAGMTFWNLELGVRQEMATLRVEASALALSLTPPRLPDSINAAPLYLRAQDAFDVQNGVTAKDEQARYHERSQRHEQVRTWLGMEKRAFDPDDPEMLEFLARQEPVFELARQASRMPGFDLGANYHFPAFESPIAMPMPDVSYMRRIGAMFCLSARVKAHQGQAVEAMADLSTTLAMASHCTDELPLYATLVAVALERGVFEAFEYAMTQGPMTAEALDAFSVDPARGFADLCVRCFRIEAAGTAYCFTLEEPPKEFFTDWNSDKISNPRGICVYYFTTPYRVFLWRKDLEAHRQVVERRNQLATMPFYQAVHDLRKIDNEWPGGLLTSAILPSLTRVRELAAEADARHRLMVLAVAMWRYRLAEGAFPETLGQLVPAYLPAVPVDPFSGEGLKMARSPEGLVTIYSIGPDLKDDGGTLDLNTKLNPPPGDIRLTLGGAATSD